MLTDGPCIVLTPTHHAFDIYKHFRGATPLQAKLETQRFGTGDVELPAVEGPRAEEGSTQLALVNLDPQHAARVVTNLNAQSAAIRFPKTERRSRNVL